MPPECFRFQNDLPPATLPYASLILKANNDLRQGVSGSWMVEIDTSKLFFALSCKSGVKSSLASVNLPSVF
jgi:hypothetical protein